MLRGVLQESKMPDNDLNGARQPDHATWTDPQYLLNALPDAGGDGQKAESSHDDVEQSKVLFVLRSLPATAKCRDAVASVTDEFKEKLGNSREQSRGKFIVRHDINDRISLYTGSVTTLALDAVVNAANNELKPGGGGVCGAIHAVAGSDMSDYCASIAPLQTSETAVSPGFALPAKHVLHCVGPNGEDSDALHQCYQNCLSTMSEHKWSSLGLVSISTGIFQYPPIPAAHIALRTVREWMENHGNLSEIERIVFIVKQPLSEVVYETLMSDYFPID